jgi:hypothetical protein
MSNSKRYEVINRSGYSHEVLLSTDDEDEAIKFATNYSKKAEVYDMKGMFKKTIYKNF